ncbi:MAG: hypothetical protein AAGG69_05455 [Pseudomonadota bacterium]
MAIALTLLTIGNLVVAYLYICQKALERSLAEDKPVWPAIVPVGERTYGKMAAATPAPVARGVLDPKPAAKKPAAKKASTKKPAAKKTAAKKPASRKAKA